MLGYSVCIIYFTTFNEERGKYIYIYIYIEEERENTLL